MQFSRDCCHVLRLRLKVFITPSVSTAATDGSNVPYIYQYLAFRTADKSGNLGVRVHLLLWGNQDFSSALRR